VKGADDSLPPPPTGVLLIDKPVGPTSFRIVQMVRRGLGVKKVGHAGTLDPFASGLLIVCVGREATRLVPQLMEGDKEYQAMLRLGITTDTHDPEGKIIAEGPVTEEHLNRLPQVAAAFLGEQEQTPPAYSAVKHLGKPLYAYARQGQPVSKPPRRIIIHQLTIEAVDRAALTVTLRVRCGKGTYIRTLAHDLGRELGCGAYLVALRRLASGPFRVETAIDGNLLFQRPIPAEQLAAALLPVTAITALTKSSEGAPAAAPDAAR